VNGILFKESRIVEAATGRLWTHRSSINPVRIFTLKRFLTSVYYVQNSSASGFPDRLVFRTGHKVSVIGSVVLPLILVRSQTKNMLGAETGQRYVRKNFACVLYTGTL